MSAITLAQGLRHPSSMSYHQNLTKEVIDELRNICSMSLGALAKWNKVMTTLKTHRLSYYIDNASVDLFLVSSDNRAGMGIDAFGAHETLAVIHETGADSDQLIKATAIEMSPLEADITNAMSFNQGLIKEADGMLSDILGSERYLTISCSHFTQPLRAAKAACRTPVKSIKDANGRLSVEMLSQNPEMAALIQKGWRWCIIPWSVANAVPELAGLGQEALNADQATYNVATELEVACNMGRKAEARGGDWAPAIRQAKAAMPPCHSYIDVIALYAQTCGGGPGVPMIRCESNSI